MKPGREILEELELHAQYKNKYDVSDDDIHPQVEQILLTQHSIRKHMERLGMGPAERAREREERRQQALAEFTSKRGGDTAVKVRNPLQDMVAADSESEGEGEGEGDGEGASHLE